MCGISVICNPYSWRYPATGSPKHHPQFSQCEIENSLKLIEHRGPDESGTFVSSDGRVGLGHVRLSIIDVAGGHQPLTNQDETVHCVVAGELYDYAKVRADLEARGVVFKTHSDSEIILGLYEHYGLDLFRYLRGEFTFVLYDSKRSLLLAARDRFGIKPLYYTFSDGRLLIANEMKAFLGFGWQARWDVESIIHLGEYGDDRTLFDGVRKLTPGYYLTYGRSDQLKLTCYWDQSYPSQDPLRFPSTPSPSSIEEAVLKVRELVVEAVQTRLRSDVPLAFYLSGGIDSASVLGIAAKTLRETDPGAELHTFTLSFPGRAEIDEGPRARRMAEHVGATVHMIEPTEQDLVDEYETTVYHAESIVPHLNPAGKAILSKEVRKLGFKVVLTGEGADETFAGYNFVMSDFLRQPDLLAPHMFGTEHILLPNTQDRAAALQHLRSLPRQDTITLRDLSFTPQPVYGEMLGGLMPPLISTVIPPDEFFASEVVERYGPSDVYSTTAESIPVLLRNRLASGDCHALHGALYIANKIFLTNVLLNLVGDRTEMLNSVEGRPAYLDHKLVEYANNLPPSIKIRPLLNETASKDPSAQKWTFTEKWVLREAVKPFVTTEIYSARKSQFNVSINKTTSSLTSALTPLQAHLKKRITKEAVESVGIFRWEAIETSLREFLERPDSPVDGGLDRNGRRLLWVLSFVVLKERFNVV